MSRTEVDMGDETEKNLKSVTLEQRDKKNDVPELGGNFVLPTSEFNYFYFKVVSRRKSKINKI